MLLTQGQATATYTAMVAVNNVGGFVDIRISSVQTESHNPVRVFEEDDGNIIVMVGGRFESHIDQDAFAKFYSIVI